jgi:hypothetical protein
VRGQSGLGLSGRQTRSVKGVRQLNSANPTKPAATPILRSLFCRKIASECAAAALGVFAVLFGIIVTAHFVRLLNRAASGGFAPDAVIAAMSFQSLNLLPVIIALTIFVAALITLTRNYRDRDGGLVCLRCPTQDLCGAAAALCPAIRVVDRGLIVIGPALGGDPQPADGSRIGLPRRNHRDRPGRLQGDPRR